MTGAANSQRAVAQAKADSSGTASFTWTQIVPPLGTILRGTVAVPSAPAASVSNVIFQGATLPPFLGSNPWGPFDVLPGEILTVATTGLVPGTTYTAMFVFQQIPAALAGAGLPIPYSSNTTNVQGIAGAQPVAVEDRIDELLALTNQSLSTAPLNLPAVALNDYSALEVNIGAGGQAVAIGVSITITRPSPGLPRITASQTVPGNPQSTNYSGRWVFEIGVKQGDTITVNVRTTSGNLNGTKVFLEGHTIPPASPFRLRGDGYLAALGRLYANSVAAGVGGAVTTLVAAPGDVGLALMLRALWISVGLGNVAAANSITSISGTLGGAAKNLLLAFGPSSSNAGSAFAETEYGDGLLLDPNTAITVPAQTGASASNNVGAVYDVIVL